MKYKVFIDGHEGTTGLRIFERISARDDLELLVIPEEKRKDAAARAEYINSADVAFLCLPDAAAKDIVQYARPEVRILDTSTAHRTDPGWDYGFPELSAAQRDKVAGSRRVAVPGCHATGFISLAAPLVNMAIADPDYPFCCHSITGFSGGGKKMIAQYADRQRSKSYDSPRQYGLGLSHKHLPEMKVMAGLSSPPVFCPIVADFYSGMEVTVPLRASLLRKKLTPAQLADALAGYYGSQKLLKVHPFGETPADGTLAANTKSGSDSIDIYVFGNDEQLLLVSLFDNLGKGASGAAVQCMNLMLGLPEDTGLTI